MSASQFAERKRNDTHRDSTFGPPTRKISPPTYRACCSCCLRLRKFMCIIRHVRFSIRSWFGSICLVLLKKRQTWAASGSCFCSSSGDWSELSLKMPSWKGGNTADRNSSWPREYEAVRSRVRSSRSARRSPALGLVLLDGDEPCFSALIDPRGRRGKRKSCSVVVGFMECAGLRVATGDVVLASIVSARGPTAAEFEGSCCRQDASARCWTGGTPGTGELSSSFVPRSSGRWVRFFPTFGWPAHRLGVCLKDAQAHQWQWVTGSGSIFPNSSTPVTFAEFTRVVNQQQCSLKRGSVFSSSSSPGSKTAVEQGDGLCHMFLGPFLSHRLI